MPSFAIIEDFNVLENRAHGLLPVLEHFSVNQLLFQGAEKTLGSGVVPAISFTAHAAHRVRFA